MERTLLELLNMEQYYMDIKRECETEFGSGNGNDIVSKRLDNAIAGLNETRYQIKQWIAY